MSALAREHIDRRPSVRPFRLLEAMRALCTEITVGLVLGVEAPPRRAALAGAIRRMLNVPVNPPLPLPGNDDGRRRRVWPREERMVVRATVLVPHRGALVRGTSTL